MSRESVIQASATPDVCTFALLVDGREVEGQLHVLSIVVSKELNRIPAASIQLRDGEASSATFEVSSSERFVPGRKIEIRLGHRGQNAPVFKGVIVGQSLRIRKSSSMLVVECRDEAIRMTHGRKCRSFADHKDSDVMEEVIGGHPLEKDVQTTDAEHEEIVQHHATDWDFLLCRAEANGQVVAVSDGKVVIARPAADAEPVATVRYGETLLELDAEIDSRWQSRSIRATSWDPGEQEVVEAEAREPSTPQAGNLSPADLAEAAGNEECVLRHGGRLGQPELLAWANGRLLKERLSKIRGRAKFRGLADVLPGHVVSVTGLGSRFEGRLYVSGVRQSLVDGRWDTDVQFGLRPELFAETFNLRPLPAAGLLPAVSGLQIGVVTALEDDPEGEDRIKVRQALTGPGEGSWARLAALDAGSQRGAFFRPEIGDEVVLGFIDDDPRCPVVLGMLHSSAKPVPEPASDANHKKGYVSREGMKLVFDDQKKSVVVETPAGNKITLSDDVKGILVQDQNNNTIRLDDQGIVMESMMNLTLKAKGDVKIEGLNMELKARAMLKAEGAATAELSGANTTVKGGMVRIN